MEEFYDDGYVPEEEYYDDDASCAEEYYYAERHDPNRPYNPDVEWGGSDKISILAMWEGDYVAEVYCWDKANRLGGYPWDGAPTHESYDNTPKTPGWSEYSENQQTWAVVLIILFVLVLIFFG